MNLQTSDVFLPPQVSRTSATAINELSEILEIGCVIVDVDYRIDSWNDWLARASGQASVDVVGKNLLDVFVMPPSVDDLHKRLVARASETEDSLMKRLTKAEKEMQYAYRFNNIIVNKIQSEACAEAVELVKKFLVDDIPETPEDSEELQQGT